MKKLFWMALGAALTLFLVTRGRALMRQLTPQGVAERIERRGTAAATGMGDFYATFKTASQAREAELRRELNIDASGHSQP